MNVVGIHRPAAVSGVSASGVRLAALPEPHVPWRPLVIGETVDGDPQRLLQVSPLRDVPGVVSCAWKPGTDVHARLAMIRAALREMRADVVVPNDLCEGFVAAALEPDVAIAAWYHADHYDGDELLLRCGELADAWRTVSDRGQRRVLARRAEWGLSIRGVGGVMPSCVTVTQRPRPVRPADGTLSLLYAGRLEKQTKRVLDLVQLVAAIRGSGVPVRLTIAGDGPAGDELRVAALAAGVLGSFDFRGVVPLGSMPALIDASDALVLVSASEGMPTVVMEAMAAGRPVAITIGCGMAASVVHHGINGVIAPTGDMRMLGGALASAFRAGSLGAMGAAAHATALSAFSPAAMGPAYDAFVREASEGRAAREPAAQRWSAILAAVESIGGVRPGDVARIAAEFEGLHGIAPGSLPTALPARPGPSARLMEAAVGKLAGLGAGRIALYGAGRHTEKAASVIAAETRIVCFIDDRAGTRGFPAEVMGRPVWSPRDALAAGIDAVIINSDEHEREMLPRARGWAGAIPVIGLYETSAVPPASSSECSVSSASYAA